MDYLTIRTIHESAVALSITGFFLRGAAGLAGAGWVRGRAAKTVPHIVDTVLLASAVALAWMLRITPFGAPWLMAKVVGLVVYIGLGMVALRPANPRGVRAVAWVGALATAGWIVSVAFTKNPLGFLAFA
jgi:uncharacterized membrane protein SirB2